MSICSHNILLIINTILIMLDVHIILIAAIFPWMVMPLFSWKSLISWPNILWVINQLCSLSELRANKNAESRTNGTVGSNGKKAPIIPSPKLINPNNANILFKTYFLIMKYARFLLNKPDVIKPYSDKNSWHPMTRNFLSIS